MGERITDLGLWIADKLTLGLSMRVGVARWERSERRFFSIHNYKDEVARYDDAIDKILLVNSVQSVLEMDARKTKEIAEESPEMQQLYGVWAEERDTAIYALDHLIGSDRRWIFNFDIPVNTNRSDSWGREVCDPQLTERWIATLPAPFGQVVGNVEYWVVFYRRMHNFFDEHLKELTDGDAFLGFFCKKCDAHYKPDAIKYRIKRGHRGPVEMKHCPKGHYV